MRIGINCGHTVDGQPGSGAIGFISESKEVRNVGYKLMNMLRNCGVDVVDCTNDYADSTRANLAEICRLANKQPLDLFVSIHFNSGGGHGSEVYTYNGKYMKQADDVLKKFAAIGFTNRGIRNQSLYVINHTDAPAMLIEVCFVDSKADTDLYNKLGPDVIAQAICSAIVGDTKIESEELKMSQYEELKGIIAQQDEIIQTLAKAVEKNTPMIYDYIDENMPEWGRPTIQKLKDKGLLKGDENGRLGLTYSEIHQYVINDRAGLYDR